MDYNLPHVTIKGSVGLTSSPVLDAAITAGDPRLFAGVDTSFNTSTQTLTKWTFGAGMVPCCMMPEVRLSLLLSGLGIGAACSCCPELRTASHFQELLLLVLDLLPVLASLRLSKHMHCCQHEDKWLKPRLLNITQAVHELVMRLGQTLGSVGQAAEETSACTLLAGWLRSDIQVGAQLLDKAEVVKLTYAQKFYEDYVGAAELTHNIKKGQSTSIVLG